MINRKRSIEKTIEKWGSLIHNDLYNLIENDTSKKRGKKEKELIERLQGLKASISLDSCSGLMYVYQGKVYKNPYDIDTDSIEDDLKDIPITKVIDTQYLIAFLDGIISRR